MTFENGNGMGSTGATLPNASIPLTSFSSEPKPCAGMLGERQVLDGYEQVESLEASERLHEQCRTRPTRWQDYSGLNARASSSECRLRRVGVGMPLRPDVKSDR